MDNQQDQSEDLHSEEISNEVYSLRLITGERVLTALAVEDMGDEGIIHMVNPLLITFSPDQNGNNIILCNDFDPLTNEEIITIHWSNILTQPTVATEYYREFYVKTLISMFIDQVRHKLTIAKKTLTSKELDQKIKEANINIMQYISGISEHFNLSLTPSGDELSSIKPDNVTVH